MRELMFDTQKYETIINEICEHKWKINDSILIKGEDLSDRRICVIKKCLKCDDVRQDLFKTTESSIFNDDTEEILEKHRLSFLK